MTAYERLMRQTIEKQNCNYGIFNDGDYYAEVDGDNILFCGECNEPKQLMTFISTRTVDEYNREYQKFVSEHPNLEERECEKRFLSIKPPKNKRRNIGLVGIPCKCQREYIAKAERQRIMNKENVLIRQNKLECFSSTVLLGETFDRYGENKHIKAAKHYADKIGALLSQRQNGLIFCGQSSAGKTVAAMCLANELLERKFNVRFKSQPEITFTDYTQRAQLLNDLIDCSILIIDDLNLETVNDTGREMIFAAVDGRIKQRKPIIVTTNHTKQTFTNPPPNANKRIFDRLSEVCYIVEDSSNNYRRKTTRG